MVSDHTINSQGFLDLMQLYKQNPLEKEKKIHLINKTH